MTDFDSIHAQRLAREIPLTLLPDVPVQAALV